MLSPLGARGGGRAARGGGGGSGSEGEGEYGAADGAAEEERLLTRTFGSAERLRGERPTHERRRSSSLSRKGSRPRGAPAQLEPGARKEQRRKSKTEASKRREAERSQARLRKQDLSLDAGGSLDAHGGSADRQPPRTPRTSASAAAGPLWASAPLPYDDLEDGGAEMVAALHQALLGAGIRGSLREQARALESRGSSMHGSGAPGHRRLPSDPSAPEFAAATSPGVTSPPGADAGGGAVPLPPRVSAPPGLAGGYGLASSRPRSHSMLVLAPMAESDADGGGGGGGGEGTSVSPGRRWSVDAAGEGRRAAAAAAASAAAALTAAAVAASARSKRHSSPAVGGAATNAAAAAVGSPTRRLPSRTHGAGGATAEARSRAAAAAAHAAAASPLVFNRPPPSPALSEQPQRRSDASADAAADAAAMSSYGGRVYGGRSAGARGAGRDAEHADDDDDADALAAAVARASGAWTPEGDGAAAASRGDGDGDDASVAGGGDDVAASGGSTPERSESPLEELMADREWDEAGYDSDGPGQEAYADEEEWEEEEEEGGAEYGEYEGGEYEGYGDSGGGQYAPYDEDGGGSATSYEGRPYYDEASEPPGHLPPSPEPGARRRVSRPWRTHTSDAGEDGAGVPPAEGAPAVALLASRSPSRHTSFGASSTASAAAAAAAAARVVSPSPERHAPRMASPGPAGPAAPPSPQFGTFGAFDLRAAAAAGAIADMHPGGAWDDRHVDVLVPPESAAHLEGRAAAMTNGSAGGPLAPVASPPPTVPSAMANRIQWERTVSDLDQLLPAGMSSSAGADGNDDVPQPRGRGGDPLVEACARANGRIATAVAAARRQFSVGVMLTSPDAAPLRVALKEAREFADALANLHPAARAILVGYLTTAVSDVAAAAVEGVQALAIHLQAQAQAASGQRRDRRLSATSAMSADSADGGGGTPRRERVSSSERNGSANGVHGANGDAASREPSSASAASAALAAAAMPPQYEAPDVSGVVAGGKPLGEALHALLRWGKNVAEFADPSDLALIDAVSKDFTAAFLQLAILWGGLVSTAHASRRQGVDDWRWAHSLEEMGKDSLMFVRSVSVQGFAQGHLAGQDYAALMNTVDSTIRIVKELDAELSAPHPAPGLGALPPGGGDGTVAGGGAAAAALGGGPPPDGFREGWEVDMTDVRLGQKVGAGSYGQVFRATWRAAPVAVKLFDKQWADSEELMAAVRREASLMARHRHPHVLLFMGVCTRPPNLAIVTEFCDNGSLHDVLRAKRDTPEALAWARRLMFAADAARGLNYLHTSRPATVHADLNTSNLLVDRGWRVKVADFGLSRLLQNAPRGVIQGTNVSNKNASHLAPEVLRSEPYGTPSDVFSFGCVLWALATLSVPWETLQAIGNNLGIAHRIAYERQRLELPREVVPAFPDLDEYNALITDCFQEDPAARPKMEAVLERLVHLQKSVIRRQQEEEARAAAGGAPAGGSAPGSGAAAAAAAAGSSGVANGAGVSRMQSGGGSYPVGLASPARTLVAATRRASNAAAVAAAAAAAQWRHQTLAPSRGWLLVAGLPVLTAVLSWAAARRMYRQQ